MITQKIQQEMGEAILLAESDVVYALSKSWLLVFTGAQHYFDNDVLRLLDEQEDDRLVVDWRVINAREIDFEQKAFIPARGRAWSDAYVSLYEYAASWSCRAQTESIRKLIDESAHALYGGVDLMELFLEGKARPVYPTPSKGTIAREPNSAATDYVFKEDHWTVGINGGLLRGLEGMGFSLNLPTEQRNEEPIIGIAHDELEPTVFGFFRPNHSVNCYKDRHGRRMYFDAARVWWKSSEYGESLLASPALHDPDTVPTRDIAALLDSDDLSYSSYWQRTLQEAVSVLRWNDYLDEYIQEVFDDFREPALRAIHESVLEEVERRVAEVRRLDFDKYKHRAEYIDAEVRKFCEKIERISDELNEDLEIGELPELVLLLKEKLSCAS